MEEVGHAEEARTASFTADGADWIARVAGLGASGRGRPGGGAPLVLITFAQAAEPDHPTRELLHVGRGLDGLSELELTELLSRARPATPLKAREDLFSDENPRKRIER